MKPKKPDRPGRRRDLPRPVPRPTSAKINPDSRHLDSRRSLYSANRPAASPADAEMAGRNDAVVLGQRIDRRRRDVQSAPVSADTLFALVRPTGPRNIRIEINCACAGSPFAGVCGLEPVAFAATS
jgi:hypothetical protein